MAICIAESGEHMCRYGRADVTLWVGVDLLFLARSVGWPPPQLRVQAPIQGQSSGWQVFALGNRREEGRFTMTVKRTSFVTPVMAIALMTVMLLVVSVVPAGAGQAEGSGIVATVTKAPIDPAGDVAGEPTDFVVTLDTSLDPDVPGRTLLKDKTIKVTLPDDFKYLGGPVLNPGGCDAAAGTCGTGVLLQGWPQNPIPPSPANYTVGLEGTQTIVFTAARDLEPGDATFNGPGIKQMHLILTNFVNPKPGRYEFLVEAETGEGGALETGIGVVHVRPNPRASINVTSVFADPPPPFGNTIYQTTTTDSMPTFDWDFLVWDRLGDPALGVTIHQVNPRTAQIKQGDRVIGTVLMRTPRGATGQEISGGPSVLLDEAPVKSLPTGRLTVQFKTGDTVGLYTTTLRMNNGTSVTMYVTATD
jgi:hypothetical protein